jgi:hypothetical protein
VAYGQGEIVVRRQQGRQAEIRSHYFGGAVIESHASIEGGQLKVMAVEHSAGAPLEWIEVHVS